nr:hypothetical protein B0A51_01518 [Rachicladosporium sp. CCFEE 5018]
MQLLKLLALAGLVTAAVLSLKPTSPDPPAAIAERDALPSGIQLTCAHDLPSSKHLMAQNLNNFLLAHSGSVIHANNFVSDTYFLPQHNVDLILRNTCGKDAVPTFDEAYKNFQRILSCSADGTSYGGTITVTGWCFKAEYNVTPKISPITARSNGTSSLHTNYIDGDEGIRINCVPGDYVGNRAWFQDKYTRWCAAHDKKPLLKYTTWIQWDTDSDVKVTWSLGNMYGNAAWPWWEGCKYNFNAIDTKCPSGQGNLEINGFPWHYSVTKEIVTAKRDVSYELIPITAGNDSVIVQDTPSLILSVTPSAIEVRRIRVYCILGPYVSDRVFIASNYDLFCTGLSNHVNQPLYAQNTTFARHTMETELSVTNTENLPRNIDPENCRGIFWAIDQCGTGSGWVDDAAWHYVISTRDLSAL